MRKRRAEPREIKPEYKYNSVLLARFINMLMKQGKKLTAQRIVYKAIEEISQKVKKDGLDVFIQAIENVKPKVKVKSRRIGGSTYQVPVEVSPERQTTLAMRWIIDFSRSKKGKAMYLCLTDEIIDSYNNTGNSFKKKEDTHRMAAANKAFAHFRW